MMDWFKWLSSSNLDPSLVHQYGILFTHNELQEDDIPFFNHEFLQSMGITIAKHRLEILKLLTPPPTKHHKPATSSKVLVAAKRTKKTFSKYILGSWAKHREDQSKALAIVPVLEDNNSSTIDHDLHGSRLSRGLTMLKRSNQRKAQTAATTPDSYYYYNKQRSMKSKAMGNGGNPLYASTPRIGSFSSSPFRKDWSQMVDRVNGHEDNDDDGYWSAGVEETRWDSMFHNLKPT